VEIASSLPPDWNKWTSPDPEISRALDEARSKPAPSTPLADAVRSMAVVWTGVGPQWEPTGPGAIDSMQSTLTPLIDLWVAERGLAHALDALAAATECVQTIHPTMIERWTRGSPPSRQPVRWRRLREHVAAASDADHAAVRTHAERVRSNATPIVRTLTSFVFPWEEGWLRADAKLQGPERLNLIGTVLDAHTCANILRNALYVDVGNTFDDGRLETMVAILGDDALEPLLAIVHQTGLELSKAVSLLARFDAPEVAVAMQRFLMRTSEGPIARAFFWRHPALTLETLVGTRGPLIKPLLACAVARDHERASERARKTRIASHKKLLFELGATDTWLKKRPPARVAAAAAPFPEVAQWLNEGAPWSGRTALSRVDAESLVGFAKAVANDALPVAMAAVDALAQQSDDVIKWLGRLADGAVRAEVSEHCRAHLAELQARLSLTDDDVEDLVAPSFSHGMLDYGARKFSARLDDDLKPALYDATGARLASLPRATKDDDAEHAAHASSAWASFRDDAAQEASGQAKRMESAMLSDRSFPDAIFRDTVVPHPVLGALARRLLWRDGDGVLFRIAEDGSFAGVDDAPVVVRAPFHIARPDTLTVTERARWSDVFASYEILQPFVQLGWRS
jgi:hypothetical protein